MPRQVRRIWACNHWHYWPPGQQQSPDDASSFDVVRINEICQGCIRNSQRHRLSSLVCTTPTIEDLRRKSAADIDPKTYVYDKEDWEQDNFDGVKTSPPRKVKSRGEPEDRAAKLPENEADRRSAKEAAAGCVGEATDGQRNKAVESADDSASSSSEEK